MGKINDFCLKHSIKNTNMINIPSTHKDPSYRYKMPKMDLR